MVSYALIFIFVQLAMIATALWESRIEGKHVGATEQVGWKINIFGTIYTEYHFWLWIVAYPLLLCLPLFVGFSWKLLVILMSSYSIGIVWEDFMWFVFNSQFNLDHFNSREVKWYSWLKIGKFEIPYFYPILIIFAFLLYLIFLLINF